MVAIPATGAPASRMLDPWRDPGAPSTRGAGASVIENEPGEPGAGRAARIAEPIESHVAIGDGRSVALTDGRGVIDWLCWPRFDSDAVFARLLDDARGGYFAVSPRRTRRSVAGYIEHTNVARTRFELEGGAMDLVDAMVIGDDDAHERSLAAEHEIVRVVSCTWGSGELDITIDPRPGFGKRRARHRIDRAGSVRFEDRARLLTLRASQPLEWRELADGALRSTVTLRSGERLALSLTYAEDAPAVLSPLSDAGTAAIQRTVNAWRRWADKARYGGPYREAVVRSALALKLLCYSPSGAIIAAPTTSLPEQRGGDKNWDYRFCWLRDAAFTARALFGLGYEDEADAFVGWLLHATRLTRPKLRVLYDVFGEAPPPEERILDFSGYGGARPVRVNNAAMDQVQLDVYGEVIDAIAQACHRGKDPDHTELEMVRDLGELVVETWRSADHGIWEPRGRPRHHVHSRVLCWVALDRLLRLSSRGALSLDSAARERFESGRAAIAEEVRASGWSDSLGSYVATLGGDRVDAALLLLSWYGFEPAHSARMKSTASVIDRTLGIGRGLVRRSLELEDDGAFMACAFWAAEHLARGGGSLAEARARFEQVLGACAPSGLCGEIVDAAGAHLGNYPQGFSHLALINAALSLEAREGRT